MEKISGSDKSHRRKYTGNSQKKVDKSQLQKYNFMSLLEINQGGISGIESQELSGLNLEELMDEIHSAGDALKETPSLENVLEYKKAVSGFLKYVVKHSLVTETSAGVNVNPLKKQKRYTIIRVVDEKLERLAAGVLQNQADKLHILEKIEEINGLLINLLK